MLPLIEWLEDSCNFHLKGEGNLKSITKLFAVSAVTATVVSIALMAGKVTDFLKESCIVKIHLLCRAPLLKC